MASGEDDSAAQKRNPDEIEPIPAKKAGVLLSDLTQFFASGR